MPKATKRERQRQNREVRREAMLAEEKRRRRFKAARNVGLLFLALAAVLVLVQLTKGDDDSSSDTSSSAAPTNFTTTCDTALPTTAAKTTLPKPGMGIDPSKQYTAVLHTTEGDVTIALDSKQAPKTVNSFVYLACKSFYNGTTFHRIVTDFVDQGGDPKGDGTGGPGYKLPDEPPADGYTAGSVAMANSGPGTSGSQFFLVVSDNGAAQLNSSGSSPYLYSTLGSMDAAGLQVAQTINSFGSNNAAGTPTKTITINGVTITAS